MAVVVLLTAAGASPAAAATFSISGTVTTTTDAPLAAASVVLSFDDGSEVTLSTGADGTYSATGVAVPSGSPDLVWIRALPPVGSALVPMHWQPTPDPNFPPFVTGDGVDVSGAPTLTDIDFALPGAGTVSGTVRDPNGDPVADAEVHLLYESSGPTQFGDVVQTALDGSYLLDAVPPWTWQVAARPVDGSPTMWSHSAAFGLVEGEDRVMDLVVPFGARVEGHVTDGSGNPVAGVTVHVTEPGNGRDTTATTGVDGAYAVVGIETRSYSVDEADVVIWFEPPTDSPLAIEFHDDEILDTSATLHQLHLGDVLTGIDAELGPKGSLSGTVTSSTGAPAAGVTVRLTAFVNWSVGSGAWWLPTVPPAITDAAGNYDLGPVDIGPWQLRFDPPPGSVDAEEWYDDEPATMVRGGGAPVVVPSGSTVTIDESLIRGGSVTGTVIGPHGTKVVTDVDAYAGSGYGGSCMCPFLVDTGADTTDENGGYRIDGLMTYPYYQITFRPEESSGLAAQHFDGVPLDCGYPGGEFFCWVQDLPVELGQVTARIDARLEPVCGAAPFPDVATTHPHCTEVSDAKATGVLSGYADGTFRPAAGLSRLGAVVSMWRLAGSPAVDTSGPSSFSDISATHPMRPAIEWAIDAGITTGYPDGTFRPSAVVTRQADVAFLWRLHGKPNEGATTGFTDVGATHPFAKAITWAHNHLITRGSPTGGVGSPRAFGPTAPVTRAAHAAFAYWTPPLP